MLLTLPPLAMRLLTNTVPQLNAYPALYLRHQPPAPIAEQSDPVQSNPATEVHHEPKSFRHIVHAQHTNYTLTELPRSRTFPPSLSPYRPPTAKIRTLDKQATKGRGNANAL